VTLCITGPPWAVKHFAQAKGAAVIEDIELELVLWDKANVGARHPEITGAMIRNTAKIKRKDPLLKWDGAHPGFYAVILMNLFRKFS
jgi:hypothetical protein